MYPQAFLSQMQLLLHEEFSEFLQSLRLPAPVSIRLNPGKNFITNLSEKVPWSRYGYFLQKRPDFASDPLWHAGAYYVQEASSMFLEQIIVQLFSDRQKLNVLDLCAAPGGKSTHLLSLLSEDSLLVANETIVSRYNALHENLIKWGYPNVIITQNDARDLAHLTHFFDLVVVDAPCSGEGLFRKDIHAVNEWSHERVMHCSLRQKRILNEIVPALRPDGILVYSTCTYNEQENEQQMRYLTQAHRFEPVELKIAPEWNIANGNIKGSYRFYPHRLKGEGLFMAVLRKKEGKSEKRLFAKKTLRRAENEKRKELDNYISELARFEWLLYKNSCHFFPKSKLSELNTLMQMLRVKSWGCEAFIIKRQLIPQHALAMSVYLNEHAYEKINLTHDEALRYLAKENLHTAISGAGWKIICFNNIPLGFVKISGSRVNNYYPNAWRLRKNNFATNTQKIPINPFTNIE
jgi:16S rRNA C967 or C1407 C5-methylase (RsmB/RsmF family)/NOL1/NOP2/fmu family ribosome biogenesis protein